MARKLRRKPPRGAALAQGIAFQQAGRLDEAAAVYRAILDAQPRHADALHLLGTVAYQRNEHPAAVELIGRAVALDARVAAFHLNLGSALQALRRLDEAVACFDRAIALQGDLPEAHYNRGNALHDLGRLDEAAAGFVRALALRPGLGEAYNNLGRILLAQHRMSQAVTCFTRALALAPANAAAHNNLGNALELLGDFGGAAVEYRRALALDPGLPLTWSNLLFGANYRPDLPPEAVWAEHRHFGARFSRPAHTIRPHANVPDPERRLRIGYVSPDFRQHSVSFFLEPVLAAHDRAAVEVFLYGEVIRADAVTGRLRDLAGHWRLTVGVGDAAMAAQIRADGIDILVDLAGHTAGNRLPVFAHRPAPVQATWLGYPNTTGLPIIDYRLTDAVADPAGAEAWHAEALARLPHGFLCYRPPADAPAPAPPDPARPPTFGSFNNLAKANPVVIRAWAALLHRVPGARLVLKSPQLTDALLHRRLLDWFAACGIDAGRLDLMGRSEGAAAHLAAYGLVDVALDPFPYNGTTTTCEALWMGVPVVTLLGDRHAGRVGASLLTTLGLGGLIAATPEDYAARAAALVEDRARLAELRASLRGRLAASPLCDEAGFTRRLEAAYRAMWRRWCAR